MTATTATVKTITHTELATLLGGLNNGSASIISLTWGGEVKPRFKRDTGRIFKVSRCAVMVNARYDRKKAKSLGVDVDKVGVGETLWKDRLAGSVYVHNGYQKDRKTGEVTYDSPKRGTRYIETYPTSGGSSEWDLDGKPSNHATVKPLLPKPRTDGVKYNLVTLTKVTGAKISGQEYTVVNG